MPCVLLLTVHYCIRVRMRQRAMQVLWCHAWLMRAVANPLYTVTSGTDSDAGSEAGAMIRQGSKLSYGSNDSGGSGSSAGAPKVGNPVASDHFASIPHCCLQGRVPEFTLLWCRVQHITPVTLFRGKLVWQCHCLLNSAHTSVQLFPEYNLQTVHVAACGGHRCMKAYHCLQTTTHYILRSLICSEQHINYPRCHLQRALLMNAYHSHRCATHTFVLLFAEQN